MPLVYNFRIVDVPDRIFPVKLLDRLVQPVNQLRLHLPVDPYIIGSHACLAGVRKFAESDPAGSQQQIGIAMHDTGAFAAKLQRYGDQPFGRLLGDDARAFPVAAPAQPRRP